MTEALQVYYARRGARPFISRWAGIAAFGAPVVVARGSDELPFALVLAGAAVAVCAWYRMSSGKAAVIVGLVLGALLGLNQLASAKSARGRTWAAVGVTHSVPAAFLAGARLISSAS